MNPVVQQIVASLVRSGLMALSGYLVARGIWTQDEADGYVRELVTILVPIVVVLGLAALGAARAYFKQKLLVTAQAMPAGVTTTQVIAVAKSEKAPPASLSKNEAPEPLPKRAVPPPEPPKAA